MTQIIRAYWFKTWFYLLILNLKEEKRHLESPYYFSKALFTEKWKYHLTSFMPTTWPSQSPNAPLISMSATGFAHSRGECNLREEKLIFQVYWGNLARTSVQIQPTNWLKGQCGLTDVEILAKRQYSNLSTAPQAAYLTAPSSRGN